MSVPFARQAVTKYKVKPREPNPRRVSSGDARRERQAREDESAFQPGIPTAADAAAVATGSKDRSTSRPDPSKRPISFGSRRQGATGFGHGNAASDFFNTAKEKKTVANPERLERNRTAALASRARKSAYVESLEQSVTELTAEVDGLRAALARHENATGAQPEASGSAARGAVENHVKEDPLASGGDSVGVRRRGRPRKVTKKATPTTAVNWAQVWLDAAAACGLPSFEKSAHILQSATTRLELYDRAGGGG